MTIVTILISVLSIVINAIIIRKNRKYDKSIKAYVDQAIANVDSMVHENEKAVKICNDMAANVNTYNEISERLIKS